MYNQGIITPVHICHVFMSGEICHSADGYVRGDHSHNLDSVTKLSFLASNFHDELRSESLVGRMGGGRGG